MLLAATILLSGSLSAQVLLGQDAYLVRQDARTFPNGYSVPARQFLMERPAEGTYLPGRVIVKTRAVHGIHNGQNTIMGSNANVALSTADVTEVHSAFGGGRLMLPYENVQLEQITGLDRTYEITYSEPIDPFDLCKKLMLAPDVEYATPVYIQQASFTPNDPRFPQQEWLTNMRLPQAWDISKGSKSVIVAIVDSGTDWQHEDLTNQIWTNTGEIPNNNKDDDNNGYVDDVRGWDFVGNVTLQEAFSGILKPDNDPRIDFPTINGTNGHGTVVAGCTGATTNNATGVASPGYNVTLMPLKCGSDRTDVPSILEGYTAIRYAADMGAHIINCSWGGQGQSPGMQDVIDYAVAKGALVVAASGNDGRDNDVTPQNPANLDGVLSVGASNNSDRVTNFSNYGWAVDVYAPGQNILSTWHGNAYNALTGTSFSSPLTSGVAALIKAVHPDWTPQMIAAQLRATVDPLTGISAGRRPQYFGRVNAERALKVNASFTTGERSPGLEVVSAVVGGGGVIRSFDPTNIDITLKNLLAEATNTTVDITIDMPGVNITSGPSITFGTVGHQEEKSAVLTLQLDENFPWYEVDLDVQLTIKSGTYLNYALVKVPVELPTSNAHQTLVGSSGGQLSFDKVGLSPSGSLWAVGTYLNQPACIRTGANNLLSLPYRVENALSVVTATHAVIGGNRSGIPNVSVTTNGGSSWTHSIVSTTMSAVAGVHMFDAQNGIAIGNGTGNRFGIMKTNNGGQSWTAINGAPLISGGSETIIPSSVFFLDNSIWFGTSNRRVIYSLDGGTTWGQGFLNATGAVIQSIAFRDKQNGTLLYRTSTAPSAPYRIASSQGSGATWQTDVMDPAAALGVNPVMVNSPGGHHLLIGEGGEVFGSDNNGAEWQVILSAPNGAVTSTSAATISRSTLLLGGDGVGQLQYRYSGPNGTKILSVENEVVDYDTLDVGRNRQRFVQVNSTGESDVIVDSVTITMVGETPDSAFRILLPLDEVIPAGTSDQIGIRVYATTPGNYEAKVRIYTNAQTPMIEATLVAVIVEPTSVEEELLASGARIAPNPAASTLRVEVPVTSTITLVNQLGQTMQTWDRVQPGTFEASVAGYPTGAYQLVFASGDAVRSIPLQIVR